MKCPEECPIYKLSLFQDELRETIIAIQKERDVVDPALYSTLPASETLKKAIMLAVKVSNFIDSGVLNFEELLKSYCEALYGYIDYYRKEGEE